MSRFDLPWLLCLPMVAGVTLGMVYLFRRPAFARSVCGDGLPASETRFCAFGFAESVSAERCGEGAGRGEIFGLM